MTVLPPLVLRADASPQIGTGHVMRCLALGAAWRAAGGAVRLVSYCPAPALQQRIAQTDLQPLFLDTPQQHVQDVMSTLREVVEQQRAAGSPFCWVALDGYHYPAACQRAVQRLGCRLLVIDDMAHHGTYHADVILNQNLGAERHVYRCAGKTVRLLGAQHALLRPEFQAYQAWQRTVPEVATRLLITMGGADPRNTTSRVLQALENPLLADVEARVLIGAANPHAAEVHRRAATLGPRVELLTAAPDMPAAMAWADLAICAAGSTCWELAFMQLPALLLTIADNQVGIAARTSELGLGRALGWDRLVSITQLAEGIDLLRRDAAARAEQSRRGRQAVDGQGAQRVLAAMHSFGPPTLRSGRG